MGIISQALGQFVPRLQSESSGSPYVFRTLDGFLIESNLGDSGVPVTPRSSVGLASVFACCKVLAEDVAALPLDLYERKGDDSREKARKHPLWELLHDKPNGWQTSLEFREQMMWSAALWGSGFAEIVMGTGGYAGELRPFQPEHITVKQLDSMRLSYEVQVPGKARRVLTQDEMFHLRGMSRDGIRGMMLFREQRNAWGMALAAERYGARLYRKGATHSGILSHPGTIGPEARKRLEESFDEEYSGVDNAGKTVALEEGVKYFPISMRATDAEWINSRKFSVIEVCRAFRMQPHKVQSLDNATFTNIEHQAIEHVQDTLDPWLVRWEQALQRDIIQDSRYYVEFNVDALLRGDMKSRFDSYGQAINAGWMTRNEVRRKENMQPLDGLDAPLQPLNMQGASDAE